MKKISLVFPFFKLLFTKPSIILKSLYHTVVKQDRKDFVKKKYDLESGLPEIDILDLFPDLHEVVDPFTNLYGTSLPIDLAILKLLVKRFDNCDYLEIGTWRGESLANVAQFCRHCVSISLSNEEMERFGWGKPFQKLQRQFSINLSNVEHIEANSRNMDFSKLGRKFDLIFVDGDHSFGGVKSDTMNVFNLLKNDKSVILWHDYTANYEHIDWEVFAGILAGTPKEKQKKLFHISNSLCAIYLNSAIPSHPFVYPAFPDKNFRMQIDAERINP